MSSSSSSSCPALKLYYFNIKGKGEPIRLFCAYAGLPLEDHRFASRDEFIALKQNGTTLAFGQVPLLQVVTRADDSQKQQKDIVVSLVQTSAILRYLARLAGRGYSDNDFLVAARIDALVDQEADAFTGLTVASYTTRFGIALDESQKAAAYHLISTDVLPRHLGNLERLASSSSTTGWLAGTAEPSIADFVWYVRLHHALPGMMEIEESVRTLKEYPALRAFCEKFHNLEAIQKYYQKAL